MVVGRYSHGDIVILDRIREMIRLGAGLDADGVISDEAAERALACLERFRERLTAMRAGSVRAVGTNTLRRARRKQDFLVRAEAALVGGAISLAAKPETISRSMVVGSSRPRSRA